MNNGTKGILLIIFLIILIFSAYKVWNYIEEENINKKLNNEIANKAVTIKPEDDKPAEEKDSVPIAVDFSVLKKENSDIVAWLYSEDTPINYPVVQGKDNEKYVHTMFNGKEGSSGTLFMDYRNDSDISDEHTIIYGHNMKNTTMFGTIQKYRNQSYYDSHKIMYLLTPTKNYKIELFTGYTTNMYSDIYDLGKLNQAKRNNLLRQSNFKSEVNLNEEDKIITLSTCAYEYDDARYVLMGVLKEEKEIDN